MDAIEALQRLIAGEGLTFSNGETLYLSDFAAIHGSPPCQGYSIMNNLPWIRDRVYPLLILPLRILLEETGKLYIIENVAGARYGAKGLIKRGLQEHGLKAAWLCGGMFGLEIYRHRYFETNWFWPQPGHPKHRRVIVAGRMIGSRAADISFSPHPRGTWEQGSEETHPGQSQQANILVPYGASLTPGQRGIHKPEDVRKRPHLTERKPGSNGAQAVGAGVGHAAGWKVAAEAMGIDWMKRSELTQAIPPVMTCYLGRQLMAGLNV